MSSWVREATENLTGRVVRVCILGSSGDYGKLGSGKEIGQLRPAAVQQRR